MTRFLGILALIVSFASNLAADTPPEYQQSYDPQTGFTAAQTNLTKIFLQVAGSLEHHGSPAPYIRHMQAEHKRISALFAKQTGKATTRMPAHMTDEYIDKFIANWNALSPKLGLDKLAREAGRSAREAIQGPDGNGTVLIHILNRHQEEIVKTMQNKGENGIFENLRRMLAAELEFAETSEGSAGNRSIKPSISILVDLEAALTKAEREQYQSFLMKERFLPSDSKALETFYKGPYDKLTEQGKAQMSRRVWAGTRKSAAPNKENSPIKPFREFQEAKAAIFEKIDAALTPEKAALIKKAIDGAFLDTARLAHSEFEIGMLEWSVKN